MSLRVEVSGEERVTEIRRIAREFWTEKDFLLRNGCTVLRDDELISDVIRKDETVFLMECEGAGEETESTDRLSRFTYRDPWQTDSGPAPMSS